MKKIILLFVLLTVISLKQNELSAQFENKDFSKTSALTEIKFNGPGTNASFGRSISSAGDINADGFDDIMVSAYTNNSTRGNVYIYFGGTNVNTIPDLILTGESAGGGFGISVSNADDVNGDTYNDIIVGAYYHSAAGRAYIFYGGPSLDNIADVILDGDLNYPYFGYTVSSGDVNGDGYSDVIVGHPLYNVIGRAYVFYGGAVMDNIPDVLLDGGADHGFSYSLSSGGDVNSDGYDDVIAGQGAMSEIVQLFYGSAVMDNISDVTFKGSGPGGFGTSVSNAGDVNNDGFDDVIISSPYSFSNNEQDKAEIFLGGSSMDSIADIELIGDSLGEGFGAAVKGNCDINGDGFSDVTIGANVSSTNFGKAYVFYGGFNMDTSYDLKFYGEGSVNFYGFYSYSVSSVGDVNSDGHDDFMVGDPAYNTNTGRAYLYTSCATFCDISGPGVITVDTTLACYTGSTEGGYWELLNNPPCEAAIAGSNANDTVYINAGHFRGTFILYFKAQDSCGGTLCREVISVDNPQPVELSSFSSIVNNRDVTISWSTAMEENNSGFEIERSNVKGQTSNEWKKIGFVNGVGNSSTSQNYTYEDRNLSSGEYKYRLKQIDFNGNSGYYDLQNEVIIGNSGKIFFITKLSESI